MVTSTPKPSAAARRRSSPFWTPAQPAWTTVWTSWPGSSAARGRGTDSSRRTRTRQQGFAGPLESGNSLRAGHGGKGVEELVETVPGGQIVNEALGGDPGADEHRCPAQDIGIAMNHVGKSGHRGSLSASL